jgi:hypothetical protein
MADPRTGNLVMRLGLEEGFEVGPIRVRVIGTGYRKARLLIQAPVDQKVRLLTEELRDARTGDGRQ